MILVETSKVPWSQHWILGSSSCALDGHGCNKHLSCLDIPFEHMKYPRFLYDFLLEHLGMSMPETQKIATVFSSTPSILRYQSQFANEFDSSINNF